MGEVTPNAAQGDRLDVAEVGRRYRKRLEALGRKRSTLAAVELVLRVWIEPHLGNRALESVRSEDVEDMMRAMTADGVGAKSGEVLRRGALMRRYRRALKAAKLDPPHRFHDLRHTFGTEMAAAGVPMRTLQEWVTATWRLRSATPTTRRTSSRSRWPTGHSVIRARR